MRLVAMINHSPVFFLLFSLFFYSHFDGAFDDAEHSPIGIQDRSKLLTETDECVLKYMNGLVLKKKRLFLSSIVERCALTEYFTLEEFGDNINGSLIHSLFPLFQHSHLKKCNSFLFFGTSSYEMAAEMQILKSVDFEMLKCKYLIIDNRTNLHGVKNFVVVPELTESQLNDILLQYKDDKDYIIEHLYIAELAGIELFVEKLLRFRILYSLTVCQLTIRLPNWISDEKIWNFSESVLIDKNYILLNVLRMEHYTEFYMFANDEYQCMMRYV